LFNASKILFFMVMAIAPMRTERKENIQWIFLATVSGGAEAFKWTSKLAPMAAAILFALQY